MKILEAFLALSFLCNSYNLNDVVNFLQYTNVDETECHLLSHGIKYHYEMDYNR